MEKLFFLSKNFRIRVPPCLFCFEQRKFHQRYQNRRFVMRTFSLREEFAFFPQIILEYIIGVKYDEVGPFYFFFFFFFKPCAELGEKNFQIAKRIFEILIQVKLWKKTLQQFEAKIRKRIITAL